MAATDQRAFVRTLDVPSTASTTTVGAAFSVPDAGTMNSMLVVANLVGLTGGTLDVYLQDSFDAGVTWMDCAHFTQVTAAGTVKESAGIQPVKTNTAIGIGTLAAPGVALAAANLRSAPWAPLMRIVAVSGAGTSGVTRTQTITLVPTSYKSS
jgi:hypothetical protein